MIQSDNRKRAGRLTPLRPPEHAMQRARVMSARKKSVALMRKARYWADPEKARAIGRARRIRDRDKFLQRHRAYYRKNKEQFAARCKKYRARCSERIKENGKDYHYRRSYKVTLADVRAMLRAQGGRCAIDACRKPITERTLQLDHDHANGKARALLCGRCNTWLAAIEAIEWKRSAGAYIANHAQD